MKKPIIFLGLASLLSCDPNILEPNTEQKITKDSTSALGDTTMVIPVKRNDLAMYVRINKAEIGDTLEYESLLQVLGDTITINNGRFRGDKRAMKYAVYKNGQLYANREDESNVILSLFDNGFVMHETEGDSIKGTITNAKVWARIYNWNTFSHDTIEATIPSPITVSWKERRNHVDEEIVRENGSYHIEVNIDYSVKDTLYHALFITEPFNIGMTTGVYKSNLEGRILEMKRK